MRVVVTRPAEDAARWVQALQQEGLDAVALPLMALSALADTSALAGAWRQLGRYQAIMFVSPAAVTHFFAHYAADATLPRMWSPGPGTARALRRHGVDDAHIVQPGADSPQWDSESLWLAAAPTLQAGGRVLIVRGDQAPGPATEDGVAGADTARGVGREWLGAQLRQRGVEVEYLVAYRRALPAWTDTERHAAQALSGAGALWLFSSSQAVQHLGQLVPGQDWRAASALATHPRIAETARRAGFGVVWPSRPAIADVVASIESIR